MSQFIGLIVVLAIIIGGWWLVSQVFKASTKLQSKPFEQPAESDATKYVSVYANAEQESILLKHQGELPPLHIRNYKSAQWLALDDNGLLVNVNSRYLLRVGIYGFRIRGENYYEDAYRQLRFEPGMKVELKREPDNEYDVNAIAVDAGTGTLGYVNKQKAKSLTKLLDDGISLEARLISIDPPKVLTGTPDLMSHLYRDTNI